MTKLMQILENSLFLKVSFFIRSLYNHSSTRHVFDCLIRFWDRLVSGSLIIGWVTGRQDSFPRVTRKPSMIGGWIQKKWSAFLISVALVFEKKATFSNSKLMVGLVNFGSIITEKPFWCLGWFGTAFLLVYGLLRLLFVGFSLLGVLVVMFSSVLCLFLTFSKKSVWLIWTNSCFIKSLDEIDD